MTDDEMDVARDQMESSLDDAGIRLADLLEQIRISELELAHSVMRVESVLETLRISELMLANSERRVREFGLHGESPFTRRYNA